MVLTQLMSISAPWLSQRGGSWSGSLAPVCTSQPNDHLSCLAIEPSVTQLSYSSSGDLCSQERPWCQRVHDHPLVGRSCLHGGFLGLHFDALLLHDFVQDSTGLLAHE